jgi:hypothetical protein
MGTEFVIVLLTTIYLTVAVTLSGMLLYDSRDNVGEPDYVMILLTGFGWLPVLIRLLLRSNR